MLEAISRVVALCSSTAAEMAVDALLEHFDRARHLADLVAAILAGDLDGEVAFGEAAHDARHGAQRPEHPSREHAGRGRDDQHGETRADDHPVPGRVHRRVEAGQLLAHEQDAGQLAAGREDRIIDRDVVLAPDVGDAVIAHMALDDGIVGGTGGEFRPGRPRSIRRPNVGGDPRGAPENGRHAADQLPRHAQIAVQLLTLVRSRGLPQGRQRDDQRDCRAEQGAEDGDARELGRQLQAMDGAHWGPFSTVPPKARTKVLINRRG
jgi:hypothetical protein